MRLKQKVTSILTCILFFTLFLSLSVRGFVQISNVVYKEKIRAGKDLQVEVFFAYETDTERLSIVRAEYSINREGTIKQYLTESITLGEEQPSSVKLTIPLSDSIEGDIIKFRIFYIWSAYPLPSHDFNTEYSTSYTVNVLKPILDIDIDLKSLTPAQIILICIAVVIVLLAIAVIIKIIKKRS